MTTLSLKKPLGFETKLTLDAAQRGTVGDRGATKRVVVLDRAPTPVRSRDHGGANRDSGRFDRGDRQPEPDFQERRQPRGEAPYRPAHHDYDRPDSDFRPNYRALENRPQDNRDSRPYGGEQRGRPARPGTRPPHGVGRGREDDASDRPHVLWPPRVVVNDFDGNSISLPRVAGTALELPEDMAKIHAQLGRRFPEAFPEDLVPLSLTVEKELARALGDADLIAAAEAFLFVYRAHPAYLAAVVRNTRRVTLDGARAERIEPEEREQALWTLRALDTTFQ
ncbi:ProQ/FINO family protein [Azospirillum sp. B4]|uniref:ProQ/FINO family protein n=1 Tax=Azospirillum sp. B4 TaxID=95605 RepID=UPI00131F1E20|nr:ProQ/FINO family protein [Azospirillum sp. B4]